MNQRGFDWPKFIDGLHDYLARAFEPVAKRIAALEREVQELRTIQRTFPYEGVHTEGRIYAAGVFVTRSGALWYSICDTDSTPGKGPGWQLAVKSA